MIARALSFGPYKKIEFGPEFYKLPEDMQKAVIAHEVGHVRGHHTELRLIFAIILVVASILFKWWIFIVASSLLSWLCRKTELWADRYAVKCGYAIGMLKLLEFEHPGDFFNPPTKYRREMITLAVPTLRANSTGPA